VLAEVERQSSLAASRLPATEGAPSYEDILFTQYDGNVLDTYWVKGVGKVVALFYRYIKNDTLTHDLSNYDSTEVITIKADMPDRFNDAFLGQIKDACKLLIASVMMSGWMNIKYPAAAQKYLDESVSYAADISAKIAFRYNPAQYHSDDPASDEAIDHPADYFGAAASDEAIDHPADYFVEKPADDYNFEQYKKCCNECCNNNIE
jgi:hypothetical protein